MISFSLIWGHGPHDCTTFAHYNRTVFGPIVWYPKRLVEMQSNVLGPQTATLALTIGPQGGPIVQANGPILGPYRPCTCIGFLGPLSICLILEMAHFRPFLFVLKLGLSAQYLAILSGNILIFRARDGPSNPGPNGPYGPYGAMVHGPKGPGHQAIRPGLLGPRAKGRGLRPLLLGLGPTGQQAWGPRGHDLHSI